MMSRSIMKSAAAAVILILLFARSLTWTPKPTDCCRPAQYTIFSLVWSSRQPPSQNWQTAANYNLKKAALKMAAKMGYPTLADDDPSEIWENITDYKLKKAALYKGNDRNVTFILKDFAERKRYKITYPGYACNVTDLKEDMYASRCLPDYATYIGNCTDANITYQEWNITYPDSQVNILVQANNCMPVLEKIWYFPRKGEAAYNITAGSFTWEVADPTSFDLPSSCKQDSAVRTEPEEGILKRFLYFIKSFIA